MPKIEADFSEVIEFDDFVDPFMGEIQPTLDGRSLGQERDLTWLEEELEELRDRYG